jgi:hypothetical protein
MNTDDFFKEFRLPLETEVLNNINNYIDARGYRNSTEQIFDTNNFLEECYGPEHLKNYQLRKNNGPGENKCSLISIPPELYLNSNLDFIINKLKINYPLIRPFIFKVPPNYFLSWHRDASRTCSINIPLDVKSTLSSMTMFSPDIVNESSYSMNTHFIKVPYQVGKMYLLDVVRYHSVVNYSDQYRFSVVIIWNGYGDSYKKIMDLLSKDDLI